MDETASQKSSAAAMEAALIAAGPCNGFKSLRTLSDVKSEGEDMPNLANKADLEEWTTWLTECKNHWEELLASCKASLAELKRNVKASLPAAGKAKAKASAAKKKGKGAGKNKGQEDIYVALSMEAFSDVPKCDASVEMAVAQLGAPVFGDGLDLPMPEKVLGDFQSQFQASDTRVMTGRALQALPDELEVTCRTVCDCALLKFL